MYGIEDFVTYIYDFRSEICFILRLLDRIYSFCSLGEEKNQPKSAIAIRPI